MANYDHTTIKCDNPEVIKSIVADGEINLPKMYCQTDNINDKFTECTIMIINDIPHKDILQLSRNFPKDTITCHYSFEEDNDTLVDVVEYRNGKGKKVNLIINYNFVKLPEHLIPEEVCKQAYEQIENFFRKIDTVRKTDDGKLKADIYGEEIAYTCVIGDYKFKAIKNGMYIGFELFKKRIIEQIEWDPIEEAGYMGEPPF